MSLCQHRAGGRDPAPPPAAPGTSWEERAGNRWPKGRCTCRGLQEPGSSLQEEAIPTAGPCSPHGASCLNPVLAPHKPPRCSPREGLRARGGGQRQVLAWHRRVRAAAGLGACAAVLPEVRTARPRCSHRCWHERRCQCLLISFMEM